ncbi:hybrid sensor histidine kinase/response regulator [Belnapia moabensis]|uniref:hybrid sensor histidine kinase/response regulator n=1 Tax=Belnapia moabensis TaxID=365533 RepID=UPI00147000FF|nr:ATP-binding protein [Belnapia moabensis]
MAEPRVALRAAFRTLFAAAPEGVALLDPAGSVIDANPALRRMAGEGLRLGRPATGLLAAADRPALAALLVGVGEAALRAAPAGDSDAEWQITVEPLPEGEMLLRIVDRRTERRAEARLAEAGRLELLGRLTGGVVHDMNNLLAAIRGSADAMRAEGLAPAALAELLGIEDAARRGSALIGQLLAFVRPGEAAPGLLRLDAAIEDLVPMLRRLLRTGVRLELALDAPGAKVRLGAVELDQLLLNLAANAGQAMPDGGRLGIATRLVANEAVLEVRDTGCGIPPEAMPRLFEPFFTTRALEGGTGLGLATVRDIVAGAGGRIVVESEPDWGSCFRIHMPCFEAEATGVAAIVQGPVLVVEDEAVLRRLAERVLGRAGHALLLAESAEAALHLLERAPVPAMLVSDIALPGMDGRELARRLRGRWPGLPVVLTSGYPGLREELAAEGFQLLAKPYTPAELMAALAGARREPVTA